MPYTAPIPQIRETAVSENAAIARRWFREVWVAGGERVIDELMARVAVGWTEGRTVNGSADFKDARRLFMQVFPDLDMAAEDTIEQAGKVAVRWLATGTHVGDGLG